MPVDLCYLRFPGVKRTSLRLREGRFTGGNAMLVNGAFLMAHRERIAPVRGNADVDHRVVQPGPAVWPSSR